MTEHRSRHESRNESMGSRPMAAVPARRRPWWLLPLVLLALLAVVLLLLSRCGDESDDSGAAGVPGANATTSTPSNSPANTPTNTPPSTPAVSAGGNDSQGPSGTITAGGDRLLPLAEAQKIGAGGDLAAYSGTTATATSIAVQSVPADEGFWVGSTAADRIWVQLTGGTGESPFTVKQGDRVAFTGTVTKNTPGFARDTGVIGAEGKALLEAQGQHIVVARSALKLTP